MNPETQSQNNQNQTKNHILREIFSMNCTSTKIEWATHFPRELIALKFISQNALKPQSFEERITEFNKIMYNAFMTEANKEFFLEYYCNIMQIRKGFRLLLQVFRWKMAKVYNTEDLFMNPVREGQKNTVTILQNRHKYVFTVRELMNHLNSALTHSPSFFSEPLACKNPYTNQPFTKSALYAIYFAIRESTFVMPAVIHQYFLSSFNLQRFLNENEIEIRDVYISNYVKNLSEENVHYTVSLMFKKHNINLKINTEFPKKRLLQVMTPYLLEYYKSEYSMKHWTKAKSYVKLHTMLQDLIMVNPTFGRKKIEYETVPFSMKKKGKIIYDEVTPEMKIPSTSEFMKSHLELKPDMTNRILNVYDRMHYNGRHYNDRQYNSIVNDIEEEDDDDVDEEEEEEQEEEEEEEIQNNIVIPPHDIFDDDSENSDHDS